MYCTIKMDCKTVIDELLHNDYDLLLNTYNEAFNLTKTTAERTLLKTTFGNYLNEIATATTIDIDRFYIQLSKTYTTYYMIYLSNIDKCNLHNFNRLRDIVCIILDKYGGPHSNAKKYYLSIEEYLSDAKYN